MNLNPGCISLLESKAATCPAFASLRSLSHCFVLRTVDSGAVPRKPQGVSRLRAREKIEELQVGKVQDPEPGPVGLSSPEPSSPIMWPQPPQPLSEPSGLMSLQLEPVPEMSTIPPGERAHGAQCGQRTAHSARTASNGRKDKHQPGPGIATQPCREN